MPEPSFARTELAPAGSRKHLTQTMSDRARSGKINLVAGLRTAIQRLVAETWANTGMRRPSRRSARFSLSLLLVLAGCGWEPLYADRQTGPADEGLRAISVAPIPERIGQKLAWALRESLNPTGIQTPMRYVLRTTLQTVRADLGVQSFGLGTRGKFDVYATYVLTDTKTNVAQLSTLSHVAESFDILPNEYAAIVAENDAVTRAIEELRRDIVNQLTIFMQRRVAAAAPVVVPGTAR